MPRHRPNPRDGGIVTSSPIARVAVALTSPRLAFSQRKARSFLLGSVLGLVGQLSGGVGSVGDVAHLRDWPEQPVVELAEEGESEMSWMIGVMFSRGMPQSTRVPLLGSPHVRRGRARRVMVAPHRAWAFEGRCPVTRLVTTSGSRWVKGCHPTLIRVP